MQIMEGDVIHTIRENHQYYGHFHTAGVPGRNEIDESQEVILSSHYGSHIVETGFKGVGCARVHTSETKQTMGLILLADSYSPM